MSDLAAWLLEQIAEDERVAQNLVTTAHLNGPLTGQHALWADVLTVVYRVLAECEAKRRIVERHDPKPCAGKPVCADCGGAEWKPTGGRLEPYPWVMPWPCPTLRLLALPYADRPGYREEWAA